MKIQQKKFFLGGSGGSVGGRWRSGSGWGGVRVDVNEELKFFGVGFGGQNGCERRIAVL